MTEQETEYTINELKELDEDAYDRALDGLRATGWYDEVDYSDDEEYWVERFKDEFGITLDWDSLYVDGYTVSVTWSITDGRKFIDQMVKDYKLQRPERYHALFGQAFDGIHWESKRYRGYATIGYNSWNCSDHPLLNAIIGEINDFIDDVRDDVNNTINSSFEAYSEYRQSDEYMHELAEANEFRFNAEGERL